VARLDGEQATLLDEALRSPGEISIGRGVCFARSRFSDVGSLNAIHVRLFLGGWKHHGHHREERQGREIAEI
jgi:hypothetical protein